MGGCHHTPHTHKTWPQYAYEQQRKKSNKLVNASTVEPQPNPVRGARMYRLVVFGGYIKLHPRGAPTHLVPASSSHFTLLLFYLRLVQYQTRLLIILDFFFFLKKTSLFNYSRKVEASLASRTFLSSLPSLWFLRTRHSLPIVPLRVPAAGPAAACTRPKTAPANANQCGACH